MAENTRLKSIDERTIKELNICRNGDSSYRNGPVHVIMQNRRVSTVDDKYENIPVNAPDDMQNKTELKMDDSDESIEIYRLCSPLPTWKIQQWERKFKTNPKQML